jgi:hypothetical protein
MPHAPEGRPFMFKRTLIALGAPVVLAFVFMLADCSGGTSPGLASGDGGSNADRHVGSGSGSGSRAGSGEDARGGESASSTGMTGSGDGGTVDASVLAHCPAPVARPNDAGVWSCNSTVGLTGPTPTCSTTWPCDQDAGTPIATPFATPACETTPSKTFLPYHYNDGPPLQWTDPVTGDTQSACLYVPPAAAHEPLPLLVFFAPSGGSTQSDYDETLLRNKATDSSLGPADAGFLLTSLQPRAVHDVYDPAHGSFAWDTNFRDLSSPSCNEDIRAADQLIDRIVAKGDVDPKRIYVSGHSSGAVFAELYGITRHTTATPGGSKVAAVSVYAGADPFNNIDTQTPSCQLHPYPTSDVPIQVVHRVCDVFVACDDAQQAYFKLPPGDSVETWLSTTLPQVMHDPNGEDVLLNTDFSNAAASACMPPPGSDGGGTGCTYALGFAAHIDWPDGVLNHSVDVEPQMLAFLAAHPLP